MRDSIELEGFNIESYIDSLKEELIRIADIKAIQYSFDFINDVPLQDSKYKWEEDICYIK